jgi:histidinol-phosphatase
MPASYTDDLRLAHLLADDADASSTSRFRALDLRVDTKPDLTPVTDADRAVEEGLRRTLARARPRDAVLGEELGAQPGLDPGRARRWVVDPIDGTKNFVRGVPVWATLIALTVEEEVVVGVVSAPALNRRWWAVKDGGAWSGRSMHKAAPCRVSDVSRLEDASLSYASLNGWEQRGRLEDFLALARQCWRTRGYGDFWSYVLVAEGSVDLAAEPELEVYDMAALDVIVREAGGRFSSLAGRDGPYGGNALASNGMLHEVALGFLGAVDRDPEEPAEHGPTGPPAGSVPPGGAVLDLASRRRPASWGPGSGEPDPSPGVPPLG